MGIDPKILEEAPPNWQGNTEPANHQTVRAAISGHGRLLAARRLGLAEVPVMVARGWSEEDRRVYCLADNRLAL